VNAYLRVVRLQGNKEQPEVPFIKHSLRTAAGALDQFIARALGQPSQVVKEWVDALLLQNIDFHTDVRPDEALLSASASHPTSQAASSPPSSDNPAWDKHQLKTLIDAAKVHQQAGQHREADQQLQAALNMLEAHPQPQPELTGKLWSLRGRFFKQN